MEQVLLVIHVMIATALIGAVLLQRSETDGFGLGGGSGSNFLSGRATANLLTRTTAILATLFIANSLLLSVLAARHHGDSIVNTISAQEEAPGTSAPAVPSAADEPLVKDRATEEKTTDAKPANITAKTKKTEAVKAQPAAAAKNEEPAVPTAE